MRQEFPRFVDDRRISIKCGVGFAGGLGSSVVLRCHISNRSPLRFAVDAIEGLVPGIRERQKTISPFLHRRCGKGSERDHYQEKEQDRKRVWTMHKDKV